MALLHSVRESTQPRVPITQLITIKRRELKAMATGFSKIISGQQGLPILGCVRFCVEAAPWTYRIKAYDGVYPNYKQVIPSGNDAAHWIRFAKDVSYFYEGYTQFKTEEL